MTKIDAKPRCPASAGGPIRKKQSFKGSILLLFGISLTLSPAFAQAQEFDIDAGPAVAGLSEFAAQADVSVVYTYDAVDGLETNEVEGVYEPDQALRLLLAGTGLSVYEGEGGAFAVATRDGGGDSDSKNFQSTPVLMAQNTGSQTTSTEIGSQSDDGATSVITGRVTDARTGANLKGAKVTIEETGQWTSTGDLGQFRFARVPEGEYTLTVSFLGYAAQAVTIGVRDDVVSHNFALRGGSAIEEVVVFGQRSARAIALNQERTAQNSSTVLSADFLGRFNATTISEALRRAPGISFEEDPLTGEGTNVIVRGLQPDLNQVTLNGLRLPEGTGVGRSPDLGNILTESVSKITINKTLLPSQDGAGAGGLIEIETKGPLDRPKRLAHFGAEGSRSDGDFLKDYLLSGTISGTFGENDDVGLSASVQYRERSIQQLAYHVATDLDRSFGQYLPVDANGDPVVNINLIDPREPFPFEAGVQDIYPINVNNSYNSADGTNVSVTLAAQWQIGLHTDLRIDYTLADETLDTFERTVAVEPFFGRELLDVGSPDGIPRSAIVSEDIFAGLGFPGVLLNANQTYRSSSNQSNVTDVLSFRGSTNLGKWEFDYSLGLAGAKTESPRIESIRAVRALSVDTLAIDSSWLLPQALSNTVEGRIVHLFAPLSGNNYPLPLVNQAGFDFFDNSANYSPQFGQIFAGQVGQNDREIIKLSARYDLDQEYFKYLEFGFFDEAAEFSSIIGDSSDNANISTSAATIADLGLTFDQETLSDIGVDGGFRVISESDIRAFFSGLASNPNVSLTPPSPLDSRFLEPFTKEDTTAYYMQGRLDIGKLEVVGGVRVEEVEIKTRNVTGSTLIDENGVFDTDFFTTNATLVDQEATQTDLLPRVVATYRHSDNLVLRAGIGTSVARPQIENLSSDQNLSIDLRPNYGIFNNQPIIVVNQGNPDLEPARTVSYDISAEYYFDNVGLFELSVFYKEIENLLELTSVSSNDTDPIESIVLPADPRIQANLSDFYVVTTTPRNNSEKGEIWGSEVVFERQFDSLPNVWGGLGVYLNYTFTDSSRSQPFQAIDPSTFELLNIQIGDVPFSGDPNHSGTAALTYNKFSIDASLSYTAQERRLSTFGRNNLSAYSEADNSLDFRAEYQFGRSNRNWRVFISGSDLLKGTDDPDVETSIGGTGSTPKVFTGGNYLGGRTIAVGVSSTF